MVSRSATRIFLGMLLLLLLPRPSRCQIINGSIVGNVTDPSNAAVGGATVKILQVQSNQSRQLTTNDAGNYTFSDTPVGTYDVYIVTKQGFQTSTFRGVSVEPNTVVRVDATLQVGTISQSVSVSAEAAVFADRPCRYSLRSAHAADRECPRARQELSEVFFSWSQARRSQTTSKQAVSTTPRAR